MKDKIFIDIDDLVQIVDTMAEEESIYLNTENGNLASLNEWGGIIGKEGQLIEDDSILYNKKYLNIPYIEPDQRIAEMNAFIQKIKNPELRQKLIQIIKDKKSIRFFLSELAKFPPEYDQWVEFKKICTRQWIYEWLDKNNIHWQKKLN